MDERGAKRSLEGLSALVTGAASGNGRAIAQAFAREGASLTLADLNTGGLAETASLIAAAGGRAEFVAADVSSKQDVEAMISASISNFGKLDILVNNAGILRGAPILDHSLEDWERLIAINLKGVFLGMQAAAAHMRQRGFGVIINMSSSASVFPVPGKAGYAASKSGVSAMTRVAAWELGRYGIRVNAIAPGGIRTAMTVSAFSDPSMPEWEARIPAGRAGEPEDVADVAVFLAGNGARYMTGQILHVDGGSTLLAGMPGIEGAIRHERPST